MNHYIINLRSAVSCSFSILTIKSNFTNHQHKKHNSSAILKFYNSSVILVSGFTSKSMLRSQKFLGNLNARVRKWSNFKPSIVWRFCPLCYIWSKRKKTLIKMRSFWFYISFIQCLFQVCLAVTIVYYWHTTSTNDEGERHNNPYGLLCSGECISLDAYNSNVFFSVFVDFSSAWNEYNERNLFPFAIQLCASFLFFSFVFFSLFFSFLGLNRFTNSLFCSSCIKSCQLHCSLAYDSRFFCGFFGFPFPKISAFLNSVKGKAIHYLF